MYVCMYVCMYLCMYVSIYLFMYLCIYISKIDVCMCVLYASWFRVQTEV